MEHQKPSIGRIVHFQCAAEGKVEPAIITGVNADGWSVDLTIFGAGETLYGMNVPFDDIGHAPGTWRWPARV